MKCEGCDKQINPVTDYYITVDEFPLPPFHLDCEELQFCSWYCASSILNEKASEEREAEKAGA